MPPGMVSWGYRLVGLSFWIGVGLSAVTCRSGSSEGERRQASVGSAAARVAADQALTEPQSNATVRADWLEITTGGGKSDAVLPWVLAVHGLGDRPEAFSRLFQDFPVAAHVYVLRAPRPYHNGFDWFGVQVSGPPDALAQAVRHAADGVAAIAVVLARDPRNAGLPVVTGFSQGGYVSFAMAALHPELIRAALPVAGSLPRPLWPTRASDNLPPIIAFHGVADPVVALAPTRELCDALRGQRFNATLTEYPDVGHQIAPAIFRDWQDALSAQLADTKPKASGT